MLKFILHRALTTVPVLFLPSLIVFSLVHLIPGDPVQITLGEENDPHAQEALRRELGLDRPSLEQFLRWLWRLLQGDSAALCAAISPCWGRSASGCQ